MSKNGVKIDAKTTKSHYTKQMPRVPTNRRKL